ncbi:MAG: AAA family ATPase [Psychroflexus sp.]|nr:AAA family ATPase [Psychroflexus sp.]MDN6310371.1 AAA family ATPase [Psychroflexus sp.]
MKILKLQFKNINSLKGEHEIDFTKSPFTDHNLFAITGPTGSGKTTLLDVISLALFNHIPRLGKISTNEILKKGAILTRNQKEAHAEVTYSCQAGTFRSYWEISTARTGKLREYEMFIADVSTAKNLDFKKSEVPAKNEELIGLSYDQFIKSVVLAQGEFARFLKVKKEERGELLEKITGTGIYRRLGQMAFYKHRDLDNAIKNQQVKISAYEEQLIPEEDYKTKEKQAQSLKNIKAQLEKKTDLLKHQIEDRQELKKLEEDLQSINQQKAQNDKQLSVFEEEKGCRLNKHQQLQGFTDAIHQWKTSQEQLAQLQKRKKENEKSLKELADKREQNKTDFSSLFGLEFSDTDFQNTLTTYKQKVRDLKEERGKILTEYTALARNIQDNLNDFQVELAKNKPHETLRKIKKLLDSLKTEKETLESTYSFSETTDTEKEQDQIQLQLKQNRAAEKAFLEIEQKEKELKTDKQELDKNQVEIKNFPQKINQLEGQIELQTAQLEAQENALKIADLEKKLEDFRQDLEPEKPCPLCGSKQHPYAKHVPQHENNLDVAITTLRAQLGESQKELTQIKTKLESSNTRNEKLEDKISIYQAALKTKKDNYNTQFSDQLSQLKIASFAALENQFDQKIKALQKLAKLTQQSLQLEKSLKSLEGLSDLLEKGIAKKKAIKALYAGDDFENELSQVEQTYLNVTKEIEQLQKTQTQGLKELEKLRLKQQKRSDHLIQELEALGYGSIPEAIKNILSHDLSSQYQNERQAFKDKQISFDTQIKDIHKQLKILIEKVVDTAIEKLKDELQTQSKRQKTNEDQLNELQRVLKNQEENLNSIARLKFDISEQLKVNKRWETMKKLIGDRDGKKFNDYAQDITLSQLLILANKRLALLTDRYEIDKPLGEEDDSLMAIDAHMGGQRRSVKTLSGGETFIMSLALALALSDFASRNVEINSLFIDEGFGTLDPETLDQTLDTLEVLQAKSSKMIGIISHVSSLKERIATQIQLTQNGQGYSTIKVI